MKAGFSRDKLLKEYKIIQEFPFDSARKMMTIIVQDKKGDRYAITKGAPDILINLSESVFANGRQQFLNQQWKTIMLDNRPWRNYCKVVVERIDDAE